MQNVVRKSYLLRHFFQVLRVHFFFLPLHLLKPDWEKRPGSVLIFLTTKKLPSCLPLFFIEDAPVLVPDGGEVGVAGGRGGGEGRLFAPASGQLLPLLRPVSDKRKNRWILERKREGGRERERGKEWKREREKESQGVSKKRLSKSSCSPWLGREKIDR